MTDLADLEACAIGYKPRSFSEFRAVEGYIPCDCFHDHASHFGRLRWAMLKPTEVEQNEVRIRLD